MSVLVRLNNCYYYRFLETPEICIIGIFVLLKYENELELVSSDIRFNSVNL